MTKVLYGVGAIVIGLMLVIISNMNTKPIPEQIVATCGNDVECQTRQYERVNVRLMQERQQSEDDGVRLP